jgi:hypothetical protein
MLIKVEKVIHKVSNCVELWENVSNFDFQK